MRGWSGLPDRPWGSMRAKAATSIRPPTSSSSHALRSGSRILRSTMANQRTPATRASAANTRLHPRRRRSSEAYWPEKRPDRTTAPKSGGNTRRSRRRHLWSPGGTFRLQEENDLVGQNEAELFPRDALEGLGVVRQVAQLRPQSLVVGRDLRGPLAAPP